MPREFQIVGYVPHDHHSQFCEYAAEVGVPNSVLGLLLLHRELKLSRLQVLAARYPPAPKASCKHIAVSFATAAAKDAFVGHASGMQYSATYAAGVVFRAEVDERWLIKALSRDST